MKLTQLTVLFSQNTQYPSLGMNYMEPFCLGNKLARTPATETNCVMGKYTDSILTI